MCGKKELFTKLYPIRLEVKSCNDSKVHVKGKAKLA